MNYGENGIDIISDTDPHEGLWNKLVVIEEAKFDTLEDNIGVDSHGVTLSGITFKENFTSEGRFKKVKLVSGTVLLQRA